MLDQIIVFTEILKTTKAYLMETSREMHTEKVKQTMLTCSVIHIPKTDIYLVN